MGFARISEKNSMIICLSIIVFITAIVFLPSLFNGFVDWDDPAYVMENEKIRDLSVQNIKNIFTSGWGIYSPLAVFSYALEYHFFKLDPFIYHLTNYILHLVITVSVFCFIYLLSQKLDIAFITAILFGIHPLHVESVAWISERKDLLCAIFYVLALIVYLIYLKRRKMGYFILSFLFAAFSLLSKPMAVTIPVIFVLLDYFCGRKIDKRTILEKIPVFALAFVFGIINLYFGIKSGATAVAVDTSSKVYFTSKSIFFYLSKTFIPINLSAMYPYYRSVTPAQISEIKYYLAVLLILIILVIFSGKYSKKIIFGSAFFVITVAPVLKIIPAGDVFVADRYMYLPSIGIFYIFAVFLDSIFNSKIAKIRGLKLAIVSFFSLVVISLSVLTWKRCFVWKDTRTLFMDVMRRYPTCAVPYNKVGVYYAKKRDFDKAIPLLKKALELRPDFTLARANLELAYKEKKAFEGEEEDSKGIQPGADEAVPEEAELFNRMGVEHGKKGNYEEAIRLFKKAIELDADYAEAYNNLGFSCYQTGEYELAEEYFKKALEIDPDHFKARINLDFIEKQKKQTK